MTLSAADRERISTAIHQAEAKSSGEIVCVLANNSSSPTALPIFIAALVALALPWFLVAFTAMVVERMLALQVILFFALTALLCIPRVRVALMPRRTRRALAHRVAMEQFRARGIEGKKNRCGILIFVSLAERYARIIADDGIAVHVPQSTWQGAIDELVAHMREGRVADGFVAAVNACGGELATHFPRDGSSRDELPDRIYVI
jgi:putative membrane protein